MRVVEGARKSEQERSAALLCLRSPLPALVCRPTTATQPFQAERPRVANKQARAPVVTRDRVQKLDSFIAKVPS